MKFAEELFPKGTFKDQETDGAYINETLAANLDVIAKNVVNDMTFMLLISGHDMVGDGKSTLMTHVGSYLTWKINKLHGKNNTFTDKNVFMNSLRLIDGSFDLPPLSVIGLDEGDDLTTHGLKDLAIRLKRYFRKCRQLNQILILILPSFFELPKFYALNRSHLLIDVMFQKEYERGYFKFYSPHSKKLLYLKGKKEWNYDVQRADFHGRFFASYCFFPNLDECVKHYKNKKYRDMLEYSEDNDVYKSKAQIEKEVTIKLFKQLYQNMEGMTIEKLSIAFGVHKNTGSRWINKEIDENKGTANLTEPPAPSITYNSIKKENIFEDDDKTKDETN